MEKIVIKNKNKCVEIEKTACLAPMASVADSAYRTMCKNYHASYLISEMVSAKGLCYNDKKTAELCTISDFERPMAIQIFGDEPEFIYKGVKLLEPFSPDIIDINMGCPVPKIAGNGAGSALMKNPSLAKEIVAAAVSATDVPITVKIRSGWDFESINALSFALEMESAGASAIAIHPRTRNQMYAGKADWDIIKQVKNAVKVPVIGNGDVVDLDSCLKMYEYTGCDLVMIGQGSYGRPWVFENIYRHFANLPLFPEPNLAEKLDVMLKHAKLIVENKGEKMGIREARKHIAWYLKGMKNAASYRNSCAYLNTFSDIENLAKEIIETNI